MIGALYALARPALRALGPERAHRAAILHELRAVIPRPTPAALRDFAAFRADRDAEDAARDRTNRAFWETLVRQDAEINRLNRCVFQRAVAIGTDEDRREWAMHMMLMARALERVGDNAVDVGEQVAFVETGLFREFSDASHGPAGS